MDEPQSLDGQLSEAIFVEMVRSGLLHPDIIERVAERFDVEEAYYAGNSRSERYATLAAMARKIMLEAAAPTAQQSRDAQLRRSMPHIPPRGPKSDR